MFPLPDKQNAVLTRIQTWFATATMQRTNHYTTTGEPLAYGSKYGQRRACPMQRGSGVPQELSGGASRHCSLRPRTRHGPWSPLIHLGCLRPWIYHGHLNSLPWSLRLYVLSASCVSVSSRSHSLPGVSSAPPWWAPVSSALPWWAPVSSAPPWWAPVSSALPWRALSRLLHPGGRLSRLLRPGGRLSRLFRPGGRLT